MRWTKPARPKRRGVTGCMRWPTPPARGRLLTPRGGPCCTAARCLVTAHRRSGTVGPGTRVVGALFDAVGAGIEAGDVSKTEVVVPQPLSSDYDGVREEFDFSGDDSALAKCFLLWAGLIGAISLEVFGQYGQDTLTDPAVAFDVQVKLLIEMLTK